MSQVSTSNGPAAEEDDTFERDLKEMLKDGPSLNDLSSTVQGGNPVGPGAPPASAMRGQPGTGANMARPQSMPQGAMPQGGFHTGSTTSNIPLSSPERNGADPVHSLPSPGANASSKIDTIKAWTINTYKCTRQIVQERLGRSTRTVDAELEAQIETLRDTQRKYANILRLARALSSHFHHVVQTQRQLGDAFCEMSQKNPELQNEFQYNAETQKVLCKNGETLLGAINFFVSSLNTLCSKTIEDTFGTVNKFYSARIEFDAYRQERDALQNSPRDASSMARLTDAEANFAKHKEKYDKLRADVAIKLKFLDENKVKVMHKQLLLFHNAVAAYFSGNQDALEATLKQFNIKLKPPNTDKPSWLEQ